MGCFPGLCLGSIWLYVISEASNSLSFACMHMCFFHQPNISSFKCVNNNPQSKDGENKSILKSPNIQGKILSFVTWKDVCSLASIKE